jgi:GDSL-like Lipase/Acylhydrolase family
VADDEPVASPRRRRWRKGLLVSCLSLVAILAGLEVILRGHNRLRRAMLEVPENAWPIGVDDELGWRARPEFDYESTRADGVRYHYTTDAHGFRMWGDPTSQRPKLLVLGDSFTQTWELDAEDTYFGRAGRALDWEVFACGASGYGTLQELLILERTQAEIDPDVVLLQLCPNDLYNNCYALERASWNHNNGMRRPYWEDGQVVFRTPRALPALREFAVRGSSELLYFVYTRVDRITAQWGQELEREIESQGEAHPLLAEAAGVTGTLLRRFREACGERPVLAFTTHPRPPYHDLLRRLAEQAGMTWIDGVPQAIAAAEARGEGCRGPDGGHWNERGHALVAERVVESLRATGLEPQ